MELDEKGRNVCCGVGSDVIRERIQIKSFPASEKNGISK